jgi:hypothetical protein
MLASHQTPTLEDQGISPSLSGTSLNMYPLRMALPGTRLAPAWLLAFTDARKHPLHGLLCLRQSGYGIEGESHTVTESGTSVDCIACLKLFNSDQRRIKDIVLYRTVEIHRHHYVCQHQDRPVRSRTVVLISP